MRLLVIEIIEFIGVHVKCERICFTDLLVSLKLVSVIILRTLSCTSINIEICLRGMRDSGLGVVL